MLIRAGGAGKEREKGQEESREGREEGGEAEVGGGRERASRGRAVDSRLGAGKDGSRYLAAGHRVYLAWPADNAGGAICAVGLARRSLFVKHLSLLSGTVQCRLSGRSVDPALLSGGLVVYFGLVQQCTPEPPPPLRRGQGNTPASHVDQ